MWVHRQFKKLQALDPKQPEQSPQLSTAFTQLLETLSKEADQGNPDPLEKDVELGQR